MEEYISKVKLNYEFYEGKDLYSDGLIEDSLLEICQKGNIREALYTSHEWAILYHLSDIRGNLIEWIPFAENASVLEIGSGCGAISTYLCKKASRVVGIELSKKRSMINAYKNKDCDNLEIMVGNFDKIEIKEKFDYVTLIGVLEYSPLYTKGENPFLEMLNKAKQYLKPDGKIIIAIENKMGLKYLNGAPEDHIGKCFAGIEDYRNIQTVRTFSRSELVDLLSKVGLTQCKLFYPVPDYKLPFSVYSEERLPNIGELRLWGTNYDAARTAFYNEAIFCDQICKDKMFGYFSNSFLVVSNFENHDYFVHYTNNRIEEFQTKTIIKEQNGIKEVEKSYLHNKIRDYDIFAKMNELYDKLQNVYPNIVYVPAKIKDGKLTYAYIEGESLDVILSRYVHNTERLVKEVKYAIEKYLQGTYEYMEDFSLTAQYRQLFGEVYPENAKSLPITNLDLNFQNIIIKENKAYGIDYEWIFNFPIPYEYSLFRIVSLFYSIYAMYLSRKISRQDFLIAVGISEKNIPIYYEMEKQFVKFAFGKNIYLQNYQKSRQMIEIRMA